jgi:hypothetical protein
MRMPELIVRISKNIEAARQMVDTTLGLLLGTGSTITAIRMPPWATDPMGVVSRGGGAQYGKHRVIRRRDLTDRVIILYKPGKRPTLKRRVAAKPAKRVKAQSKPAKAPARSRKPAAKAPKRKAKAR